MGPLKGIRVVEMAGLGAAPMCGMMLSDFGAEVFLIERKGPASAEASMHIKRRDMLNRGKTPVALDLKQPASVELVLSLLEQSDVLLESYRPGVMERLGLGPSVVHRRNPSLVYARLTGWGQTGPLAMAAGHDPNYAALTGALYHTGNAGQPPQSPPTLLGDAAGGAAMTALGICSALIPAIRNGTGQVLDAAIGEGTNYLTSLVRSFYHTGQLTDDRGSSWMEGAAPWARSYRCADGKYITLLPVEGKFYLRFLNLMELEDDFEFRDRGQWERQYWSSQQARLEQVFAERNRDYWCELLEGSDACFAPVLTYGEAPLHPHNRARGNYVEVDGDWHPAPAPRFSATPAEPAWGEEADLDAAARLRALGLTL